MFESAVVHNIVVLRCSTTNIYGVVTKNGYFDITLIQAPIPITNKTKLEFCRMYRINTYNYVEL